MNTLNEIETAMLKLTETDGVCMRLAFGSDELRRFERGDESTEPAIGIIEHPEERPVVIANGWCHETLPLPEGSSYFKINQCPEFVSPSNRQARCINLYASTNRVCKKRKGLTLILITKVLFFLMILKLSKIISISKGFPNNQLNIFINLIAKNILVFKNGSGFIFILNSKMMFFLILSIYVTLLAVLSARSHSRQNASRSRGSSGSRRGSGMGGTTAVPIRRSDDSGMSQSFPVRLTPGIRPSLQRRRTDSAENGVRSANSDGDSRRSCIYRFVEFEGLEQRKGSSIGPPTVAVLSSMSRCSSNHHSVGFSFSVFDFDSRRILVHPLMYSLFPVATPVNPVILSVYVSPNFTMILHSFLMVVFCRTLKDDRASVTLKDCRFKSLGELPFYRDGGKGNIQNQKVFLIQNSLFDISLKMFCKPLAPVPPGNALQVMRLQYSCLILSQRYYFVKRYFSVI